MNQKIYDALNRFFHHMTLNELRLMNDKATSDSVTYNTLLYYDLIATNQGKLTASAIANMLCVSKPAVITKINDMIKEGFLYKKQSTTDKRVYYLYAHTEGIRDEVKYKKMDDDVISEFVSRYSEHELQAFCHMIEDIGNLYTHKQTRK